MKIPEGMTEQEVTDALLEVAKRFGKKFKFGYYDEEDIIQFAIIQAIRVLDKYDPSKPFEPFLYCVMKRELINLKRNVFKRKEPCHSCPLKAFLPPDGCSAYEDRQDCNLYARWIKLNSAKQNIVNCIGLDSVEDYNEDNMNYSIDFDSDIDITDLYDKIDKLMPINIRKDYLKFIWGGSLSSSRRQIVFRTIKQIVENNGLI